jgi:retron-type reverse transcriptase
MKKEVSQLNIETRVKSCCIIINFVRGYNILDKSSTNLNLYSEFFKEDIYIKSYNKVKYKTCNSSTESIIYNFLKVKIQDVILAMKNCSFQFKPASLIELPKVNGQIKLVGIPSPIDKIILQAFKDLLEPIYEKLFKDSSHGFRPGRGYYTALKAIKE